MVQIYPSGSLFAPRNTQNPPTSRGAKRVEADYRLHDSSIPESSSQGQNWNGISFADNFRPATIKSG